jgi:hypothetical protein
LSEALGYSERTTAAAEDERWALVHRIVSSRHLLKAPQLREILLYLARRVLNDNAMAISEQEIGCKVLGRRPDFSPNEDNIVRVQVRRLRGKLEEYFSSDGADEPLLATIPKGAYLLSFEPRLAPSAVPANGSPQSESPASSGPARKGGTFGRSIATVRGALVVLAVLAAGFGASTLVLWKQRDTLRRGPFADEAQVRRQDPLWSRIFAPGRETNIVVADSCLVAIQDILDLDIPMHEYVNGAYPEKLVQSVPSKELQAALRLIADRQYTSLGDANIASKLVDLSHRYAVQANIRYPRFMSVRDFRTGNFILIGSRRGIPWEQLFEPELNFVLEEDRHTGKYVFRNKAPLPGEQALYSPSSGGAAHMDTYADIALLPNLAGTGHVLMLAGIDMTATEAAGELVASQDFPDVLNRMLRSRSGQPPAPYIEILVQEKAVGGTAQGSKIVGYRLLAGQKPMS